MRYRLFAIFSIVVGLALVACEKSREPDCFAMPMATSMIQPLYQFPVQFVGADRMLVQSYGTTGRFTLAGESDPAFRALSVDFSSPVVQQDDALFALSVEYVYADYAFTGLRARIARYDADGVPDESYAAAPLSLEYSPQSAPRIAAAGDGAMLLAACRQAGSDVELIAARWRADGSLDPSYGNAGVAVNRYAASTCRLQGLATRADGGAVLLVADDSGSSLIGLRRDGRLQSIEVLAAREFTSLAPLPDGGWLLGGLDDGRPLLAKVNRHLRPEHAFGEDGALVVPYPLRYGSWAAAVDSEGALAVALVSLDYGQIFQTGAIVPLTVARYSADGQPDPAGVRTDTSAGGVAVNALRFEADGSLLAAVSRGVAPTMTAYDSGCYPHSYQFKVYGIRLAR